MKRGFFFLSIITILFVFSYCFSDSGTSETDTNNTVYARLPAEPDKLNPLLSRNTYARIVNDQMFLYLLDFDPQTFELQPQLAKARPKIDELESGKYEGGIAYTYEIHETAIWDDGSPVTGKDVVFTFKILFNPLVQAGPYRTYLEFVKNIEIDPDNPKRFTVITDRKYILGEAAISNIAVYPAHIYDPSGLMETIALEQLTDAEQAAELAESNASLKTFADNFNDVKYSRENGFIQGAGPYRFEEWITGQRIVLSKKENWWGDPVADDFPLLKAYPDTLVFKIIPDQTTAVAGLKDGSIDVSAQIDAKDFVDLKQNEAFTQMYNLYAPYSLLYYYLGLNNKHPYLNDKRTRRALAHLVNVDEVIEELFYGLAERTVGPVNPAKDFYHEGLEPIPFDMEKAGALLKEVGWEDTNGNGILDRVIDGSRKEFEINYLTSTGSKFGRNLALLFQDNAKRAGIQVNIVAKEFTVLMDDIRRRDYQMYGSGWGQDPTLDDFKQLWHTESDTPDGSNRVSFGNAESDAIIDEIRVTLDKEKRDSLYLRFQEIIYEEQPYIFLFSPNERIAIHKRFEAQPSVKRPGFFVNDFIKSDVAAY